MDNKYRVYSFSEITKDVLDSIKVGNYVKCNYWLKPMMVVAVSKNYFIMIKNHFKTFVYSICEKLPSKGSRNYFSKGNFRVGPDNYYCYYDYFNLKECEEALIRLEDGYNYTPIATKDEHPNYYDWEKTASPITLKLGHLELGRHAVDLTHLEIKETKWNETNIQEYLDKHFQGKGDWEKFAKETNNSDEND